MKTIQPISIWNNGKIDNAIIFNLTCIYDNMYDSAIFSYKLIDAQIVTISSGELTMIEPDYSQYWGSNDAAYNWAATKLGLIITGDYVPV